MHSFSHLYYRVTALIYVKMLTSNVKQADLVYMSNNVIVVRIRLRNKVEKSLRCKLKILTDVLWHYKGCIEVCLAMLYTPSMFMFNHGPLTSLPGLPGFPGRPGFPWQHMTSQCFHGYRTKSHTTYILHVRYLMADLPIFVKIFSAGLLLCYVYVHAEWR